MRKLVPSVALVALAFVAVGDAKQDEKKVIKVTAEQLAKEFKDDAAAAKKKYAGAELQLTGTAGLVLGSGKDNELVVSTESKVTIRVATDKRPAKFPAPFTATAKYKDYFEMGKELSVTASKISYK